MAGVKGRSGRRPMPVELGKKEYLRSLEPKAIAVINQALEKGDKNIAVWCYEQIYGKPKQSVESTSSVKFSFDAQALLQARQAAMLHQAEVLGLPAPSIEAEYSEVPNEEA